MLLKHKIEEIDKMCHINKYFKEKVCTDYFWRLYIEKNWKDKNKAFLWASMHSHLGMIKLLLTYPKIDPSVDDNLAIRMASRHGHTKIVKLLLTNLKIDPSAGSNYGIRWASENGHLEVVKMLLNLPLFRGVDPSEHDDLAIRRASRNGHLEVVKILLNDPKVDPSALDNASIQWASQNGHLEVIKLLLKQPKIDIAKYLILQKKMSSPKIFYTGNYASANGLHTEQEFINIMNKMFTNKNWNNNVRRIIEFNDWVLPDDFIFLTLNDWIELAGAERIN